ncbi:MAG: hypothetical protein JSS58_02435 [Proteobacteria bacterium]|nr:hypothetical protein [Pseudomonadota bacterium]
MSSAFKLNEYICWGTAGAVEDILSRATELSNSMFGADAPISALLAEEQKLYWGGKVVAFESSKVSLVRLAAVLEAACEQARTSGMFTEVGIAWLTGPLAEFCQQVKLAARDAP